MLGTAEEPFSHRYAQTARSFSDSVPHACAAIPEAATAEGAPPATGGLSATTAYARVKRT